VRQIRNYREIRRPVSMPAALPPRHRSRIVQKAAIIAIVVDRFEIGVSRFPRDFFRAEDGNDEIVSSKLQSRIRNFAVAARQPVNRYNLIASQTLPDTKTPIDSLYDSSKGTKGGYYDPSISPRYALRAASYLCTRAYARAEAFRSTSRPGLLAMKST